MDKSRRKYLLRKRLQVLGFISLLQRCHPDLERFGQNGGCFRVHMLLADRFPGATPWTNVDHVITKIGHRFYDIRGVVTDTKGYVPMTDKAMLERAIDWDKDSRAGKCPSCGRPVGKIVTFAGGKEREFDVTEEVVSTAPKHKSDSLFLLKCSACILDQIPLKDLLIATKGMVGGVSKDGIAADPIQAMANALVSAIEFSDAMKVWKDAQDEAGRRLCE